MVYPIDLIKQGAAVELDEVLSMALRGHPAGGNNFSRPSTIDTRGVPATTPYRGNQFGGFGVRPDSRLDYMFSEFVRSPSPLPEPGQGNHSSPNPFEQTHTLDPNGLGGLTFSRSEDPDGGVLAGLSGQQPVQLGQTPADVATFGLRVEDPFGTPDAGRARSLLRRLVRGG